jgi:hypothetical protein
MNLLMIHLSHEALEWGGTIAVLKAGICFLAKQCGRGGLNKGSSEIESFLCLGQ